MLLFLLIIIIFNDAIKDSISQILYNILWLFLFYAGSQKKEKVQFDSIWPLVTF